MFFIDFNRVNFFLTEYEKLFEEIFGQVKVLKSFQKSESNK